MKHKKLHKLLVSLFALFLTTTAWGAVTCEQEGKILYFSYSGSGSSTLSSESSWNTFDNRNGGVTAIVIGEGITSIANSTFSGFYELKSVTVPSTLTSIGASAFASCSKTVEIHAPNPNMWASITFASQSSTPFGADPSPQISTTRSFYFYGNASPTTELHFTPGLSCINQYAFYNAQTISRVCLPASVGEIQSHALNCHMQYFVTLRTAAMTLGETKPLTFKTGVASYLYLPNGANSDYKSNTKFYDGNTATEEGASKIGYSSSDAGAITWGIGNYVYPLSGTTGSINWEILQESGTLKLYGNGAAAGTYTFNSTTFPWWRFMLLIDKVVIENIEEGDVTNIYNALKKFDGLRKITINQSTIPSISSDGISTTLIHNEGVSLEVPFSIINNGIERAKLSTSPWSSITRLKLSDAIVFSDAMDNSGVLEFIKEEDRFTSKTFDLQLRSLSNSYNNTFCSPVTLTREQVEEIWGDDTEVAAMTGTSINEDGEIELTFAKIEENALEAGIPYLVWPKTDSVTPIVRNVNLSNITTTGETVNTDYMTFTGILAPKAITKDEVNNQSIIFLSTQFNGDNQILTWANGGTLNGQRAYWQFKESTPASAMARRPILKFSDENNTATGIEPVTDNPSPVTLKQLRDGQLIIIKNGKTYNAQGAYLR